MQHSSTCQTLVAVAGGQKQPRFSVTSLHVAALLGLCCGAALLAVPTPHVWVEAWGSDLRATPMNCLLKPTQRRCHSLLSQSLRSLLKELTITFLPKLETRFPSDLLGFF